MDILTRPLNTWNKESIRPGPVGSIGDVNTSVRFKQSAPDLTPRYSPTFSGKQGEYSGSNVSDGMWHNYTSGGRAARTIREPFGYRQGFKTAVGWVKEDVRAPATSREPQMGSLGNFGFNSQVAAVQRAKVTGEMFLPLPGGYSKEMAAGIPRGSQIPVIVAESEGLGKALPAAAVKVTDPQFGENGSIDNPQMQSVPEYTINPRVVWTLPKDDPRRDTNPTDSGFIRYVKLVERGNWYNTYDWLDDSEAPQPVYDISRDEIHVVVANRTGGIQRPANEKVPFIIQQTPGRVSKPNPYEYGKPGDKAPVPGQPNTGPIGSVPGGGNGTGEGSGQGAGLQCRSGNCKGLFR